MNPSRPRQNGRRPYSMSGLYRLKSAVRELGSRAIDRRTSVGRALAAWRRELIDDLGGPDHVSTQQEALVDLLTREKLIIDSIDVYLAQLGGGIINRKKRSLLPIVRERAQLADSFTRRLVALGLERRAREAPDLGRYLADRYGSESPLEGKREKREKPPRDALPMSADGDELADAQPATGETCPPSSPLPPSSPEEDHEDAGKVGTDKTDRSQGRAPDGRYLPGKNNEDAGRGATDETDRSPP